MAQGTWASNMARSVRRIMHVAVATDAAYLPWCATTLLSALRSTSVRPFHVHVLDGGDLDAPDVDRLVGMIRQEGGEVTLLEVDERKIAHLPTKGPDLGGRVSWYRVLLPELLPDVPRVIYLDADLLVLAPLDDLFDVDLEGRSIAAVRNVVEPRMRTHVQALGITDHRAYFNAGSSCSTSMGGGRRASANGSTRSRGHTARRPGSTKTP